ncbi:hypothetical protein SUGI_1145590 [Cryptomeria japonica]|nr:hypothetical protein SUGI_1145590 [Cryptomeria japonica]
MIRLSQLDLILDCLGVVSANPDDIERHILSKAKNKEQEAEISQISAENSDGDIPEGGKQDRGSSLTKRSHIHAQLKVVEVEMAAVAAGLETVQNAASNNILFIEDSEGEKEDKELEFRENKPSLVEGSVLQHALATERLKSLKKKKGQLKKQLKAFEVEGKTQEPEEQGLFLDLGNEEDIVTKKTSHLIDKQRKVEKRNAYFQEDDEFDMALDAAASGLIETERDKLIRKGILTPFDQVRGFERRVQRSRPQKICDKPVETGDVNLSIDSISRAAASMSVTAKRRSSTKLLDAEDLPKLDPPTRPFRRLRKPINVKVFNEVEKPSKNHSSNLRKRKRPLPDQQWRNAASSDDEAWSHADHQEGNEDIMEKQKYMNKRQDGSDSANSDYEIEGDDEAIGDTEGPEEDIVTVEGGLKIPGKIFDNLFDYQKTGVKWLWELHCQRAGGIIGDEMGLGKTVQVIAFLAALHFSGIYKPSLIICPVTLLRQWRREVRKWYPQFHVAILHNSVSASSVKSNKYKGTKMEDEDGEPINNDEEEVQTVQGANKWDFLIKRTFESSSGLLITSYEQLRVLRDKLLDIEWGYAILDEGHRIRNPNAEITLLCKQLQTVHRVIMSGAPIQNKLTELWSLFDFVFPGKLGVLPVFEAQFAAPIAIGGYANASPLQVSTAYKCAVVLRDLIMPYLLRRMKSDVNAQLTKKTEHILFCSLTKEQRTAYRAFLASSDVEQIFDGSRNSLYGIDILRKICNHPDLLEKDHSGKHPDFGNPERSGKMKVLSQILNVWKDQGHRVLVFTQTQQMLDILENFLASEGLTYRRMDGLTPIKHRMALMDEFNESNHVFVFILTTRVGGLGTNLIGADRVIIFDPDWNPSNDTQARERAWRIGQTRDVTVYRLISRGTIEEKIYHRQIYKHFLTNKILKNPQQRRFFKARDMRDLFTLQDDTDENGTETSSIFSELTGEARSHDQNEQQIQAKRPVNNQIDSTSCGTHNGDQGKSISRSKGKEKVVSKEETQEDESKMLKVLLVNGIHSTMDHDAIIDINDEEKLKLDDEAAQVAQRAAEALRQSRMLRGQDGVSVPTWTGKSGAAGAPTSIRRKFGSTVNCQLVSASKSTDRSSINGASSSQGALIGLAGISTGKALSSGDLLARIQMNRESAIDAGLESQTLSGAGSSMINETQRIPSNRPMNGRIVPKSIQPEILIRQLCTFIQQNGGSVGSTKIVDHFKDRVPPKDLCLFKKLLKEIAILRKEGGQGEWVLKPDYQIDKFGAG